MTEAPLYINSVFFRQNPRSAFYITDDPAHAVFQLPFSHLIYVYRLHNIPHEHSASLFPFHLYTLVSNNG